MISVCGFRRGKRQPVIKFDRGLKGGNESCIFPDGRTLLLKEGVRPSGVLSRIRRVQSCNDIVQRVAQLGQRGDLRIDRVVHDPSHDHVVAR